MKINIVEREGYSNRIVDWKVYVRKDLTVAKASEYYYEFIEENSFRPVSELVLPEDGELLKEAVAADTLAQRLLQFHRDPVDISQFVLSSALLFIRFCIQFSVHDSAQEMLRLLHGFHHASG